MASGVVSQGSEEWQHLEEVLKEVHGGKVYRRRQNFQGDRDGGKGGGRGGRGGGASGVVIRGWLYFIIMLCYVWIFWMIFDFVTLGLF